MSAATAEDQALYGEFRNQCERELLPQALRNAVFVLFVLQTFVFIPADYVLYRGVFREFLIARLSLNAVLALIYFATSKRYPVLSSAATCFAAGALFLMMVTRTGWGESGYYAGLILLVVGMGVLAPLSGRQGFFIASVLFAGYAALPLYAVEPINWMSFSQKLFFLGAACMEAGFACVYMDRLRFADFKQRRQLEQARDELRDPDAGLPLPRDHVRERPAPVQDDQQLARSREAREPAVPDPSGAPRRGTPGGRARGGGGGARPPQGDRAHERGPR
jgi:hypothetical protein